MNGKTIAIVLNKFCAKIRSQPLVWDTVTTTGWSGLGKAIGFLIPFFIAAWFGVSSETDAFFFAYGLILLLSGVFAPVVESVIVPFIAEIKAKDETRVNTFLGTTLVLSTVGLILLSGLFLIISKPFLALVTHFPQESIELIFWLLAETIPLLVFLVGTSFLSGTLNAYKYFWLPAISPAFRAVITLFIIFALKDRIGVHSIAIGYVIGEGFRLLVLLSEVKRKGLISCRFSTDLNPELFKFFKASFFQVVGMIAIAFNPIVDKTMASWLGHGNVTILEYADRLYHIPMTLGYGLFVALLSHWSNTFYQGDEGVFRQRVVNTAKIIGGMALLFSVILILLRYPLVNLVYGYGKFPDQYLTPVTKIWGLYLIGFAPTILGFVFARAHLVLKNTKILMNLAILNCIMKILLNLVLIGPFGIYGMALSTTLTYSAISVGLYLTFLMTRIS